MHDIVGFSETVTGDTRDKLGFSNADFDVLGRFERNVSFWSKDFGMIYADTVFGELERTPSAFLDEQCQAFAVWYETLTSGKPESSFWSETCLMGLEHAVFGVHNRHVIAMASRIKHEFLSRSTSSLGIETALVPYNSFSRIIDLAVGCMVDSYHNALMTGMADIGLNERLIRRVRSVSIRKMIDRAREVLPLIEWNDSLSVGIPSIDEQHQRLVGILNALKTSEVAGENTETLARLLGELADYTVYHFDTEERLMATHGYPKLTEHRAAHQTLLAQVGQFREDFDAGRSKLSARLFLFLRTWLNGHIRGTDRAYGPFFVDRGVQ
jgi:hemerythrin-like metal-binding protein